MERQRSVNSTIITTESNSLEGLNLERGESQPINNRQSMERLDNQVSTLHQDVAALSMEVCFIVFILNAI